MKQSLIVILITVFGTAFLSILSFNALGEKYYLHYGNQSYLNSQIIYKLAIDKTGSIWCSTPNGLNQFNNQHINNFNVSHGLPQNDIPIIANDCRNQIILFGFNGLASVITQNKILSINSSWFNYSTIKAVVGLSDKNVFIDNQTIFEFDKEYKPSWKTKLPEMKINDETISAWQSNNTVSFLFNHQIYSIINHKLCETNIFIDDIVPATSFVKLADDYYAYFNQSGIVILDKNFKVYKNIKTNISGNYKKIYSHSSSSKLYYSIENNLYENTAGNNHILLKCNANIVDLITDKGHNLWIATYGDGVYQIPFITRSTEQMAEISSEKEINYFTLDYDNDIWISTNYSELGIILNNKYYYIDDKDFNDKTHVKFIISLSENKLIVAREKSYYIIHDLKQFKKNIQNGNNRVRQNEEFYFERANLKEVKTYKDVLFMSMGFYGITKRQNHTNQHLLYQRTYGIEIINKDSILVSTSSGLKCLLKNKTLSYSNSKYLNTPIIKLNKLKDNTVIFLNANLQLGLFDYQKNMATMLSFSNLSTDIQIIDFFLVNNQCVLKTNRGIFLVDLDLTVTNFKKNRLHATLFSNDRYNTFYINDSFYYFIKENKIFKAPYSKKRQTTQSGNCIIKLAHYNYQDSLFFETKTHFKPNENQLVVIISDSTYALSSYLYQIDNSNWIPVNSSTFILYNQLPGKHLLKIQELNNYKNNPITTANFIVSDYFFNTLWFRIIVFFVILFFIVYIAFEEINHRNKMSKLTYKLSESRINALVTQMNPHFVKNCLNSFYSLAASNQIEHTGKYLKNFSRLLTSYISNTDKAFIELSEEITLLKEYIELEKLRMQNQIEVKFQVNPNLNLDAILVPTMLLQPFVENTFWHAFNKENTSTKLLIIRINKRVDSVTIEIIDNGRGMLSNSSEAIEKRSTAIKNIKERLILYNKLYNKNYSVKIFDRKILKEQGTKVILEL